jgi:hypothetical protein
MDVFKLAWHKLAALYAANAVFDWKMDMASSG